MAPFAGLSLDVKELMTLSHNLYSVISRKQRDKQKLLKFSIFNLANIAALPLGLAAVALFAIKEGQERANSEWMMNELTYRSFCRNQLMQQGQQKPEIMHQLQVQVEMQLRQMEMAFKRQRMKEVEEEAKRKVDEIEAQLDVEIEDLKHKKSIVDKDLQAKQQALAQNIQQTNFGYGIA